MTIGIVGTGISGLTLALYLQRHGIETTVYAECTPDELRAGRLPNSVARFPSTQARERELGVDHWADAEHMVRTMHVHVGDALHVLGRFPEPLSAVDFRVYLPRLLEDYAARGGNVVVGAWSNDHDLLVVASGRDTVNELFPRDPARSVHDAPQRRLCAGLYRGLAYAEPEGVVYTIVPGAGEIFTMPFLSFEGWVSALLVEAIPGGPLEPVTRAPLDVDALAELLETYAPAIAARLDRGAFGLTRECDVLQGAITPTVRRSFTRLGNGRYALAIGDAWVTNDPVVAQGANLGSATGWIAGEAILAHDVYDEAFCRDVERRAWAAAQPAVDFTTAFLAPPPPHVLEIFQGASQDARVADAFAARFTAPEQMWEMVSTPEGAAAFLAETREVTAAR